MLDLFRLLDTDGEGESPVLSGNLKAGLVGFGVWVQGLRALIQIQNGFYSSARVFSLASDFESLLPWTDQRSPGLWVTIFG